MERAIARRNPFNHTDPEVVRDVLAQLTSTAHRPWVEAFMTIARACASRGAWRDAYAYARVARYPSLGSAAKREAYARSREWYLRSVADAAPRVERTLIAFRGRGGAASIPVYVRVPAAATPRPVVVCWGGIDAFKEERRTDAYCAAGWAVIAMDMPGTGEAPLAGSTDAERLWDPVFDWIAARDDLDARRVAIVGSSTGGYWAAKLAHLRRERVACAVDHGGPAHHAFERSWIERAQRGAYPFEYPESLALAFGGRTADDWIRLAPTLSLRRLGVLGRPAAPLLVVHGADDTVFPPEDARLVASAPGAELRVFPGGHMGEGDTAGPIVAWLREHLTD